MPASQAPSAVSAPSQNALDAHTHADANPATIASADQLAAVPDGSVTQALTDHAQAQLVIQPEAMADDHLADAANGADQQQHESSLHSTEQHQHAQTDVATAAGLETQPSAASDLQAQQQTEIEPPSKKQKLDDA